MTERDETTLEAERPAGTAVPMNAEAKRPWLAPSRALALAGGAVVLAVVVSAILSGRPATAGWMERGWPFVNLGLSVCLIAILISVVKIHAFLALILAAMASAMMSSAGSLPGEPAMNHWVAAIELAGASFGVTAGKIGIVIALAAIIGMCLLESGAADRIVCRFLVVFGPRHAGLALLLGTYVISIPIFFDTIFLMLVPLVHALCRRTRKDYMLYLMAICCAAAITHTMVIPHPGPAAATASLRIDAGLSALVGLVTGLIPLAVGWAGCVWINRRMNVLPATWSLNPARENEGEINSAGGRQPTLGVSLLPIALPLLLIWLASLGGLVKGHLPPALYSVMELFGHRYVALFIGAGTAIAILMRQGGLNLGQVAVRLGPPLETAGVIILITSAGGAFGASLEKAGIGNAVAAAVAGSHVSPVLLAWLVAMVMRIAQGSVTVAMITASALVVSMTAGTQPCHPIYLFLAVGYGSLFVSWMNDSGFWVISRLGGLSEKQTLASWTVLSGVLSVAGLIMTYLMSVVLPLTPR